LSRISRYWQLKNAPYSVQYISYAMHRSLFLFMRGEKSRLKGYRSPIFEVPIMYRSVWGNSAAEASIDRLGE